ncbi:SipW-cognate class signal peptide [Klenkia marina]|uniref:SipW-cognate class signal peptide n=1 Tax=Klenkia marina TaxID=1960309 RepID=A0A1G4YUT4_9ACTN|nr:TasA family protein [Klenkia marina]SCX57203.1 SipW-cognate class signal peptide [Klenkia marina]
MKKIVLASAAMGGAALVAFGAAGTFAAFSDQDQFQSQVAEAGTLFLELDDTVQTSGFDATNLAPGQSVTYTSYLENGGSLPGTLRASYDLTNNDETGCNRAEAAVDTTCGTAGVGFGELAKATQMTVYYGPVADAATCDAGARPGGVAGPFNVADLNGNTIYADQPVAEGQGICTVYVLNIPLTNENQNQIQSDNLVFRGIFVLNQATV